MLETFFIVLAGGVLLGTAIPEQAGVRAAWLRVAGVIAVAAVVAASALTLSRDGLIVTPPFFRTVQSVLVGMTAVGAVIHVLCVRLRMFGATRAIGIATFMVAVLAGSNLLHDAMLAGGKEVAFPPKALSMALQTLSAAGAGALVGLALMTALFPACGFPVLSADVASPDLAVAGSTGAASFRRLHRALLVTLGLRAVVAVGGVLALHAARPVPELWQRFGGWVPARWLFGLLAVALLASLARRRLVAGATLSATAFLLVAALLAADAELIALYLVRETGLPF